MSSTESDKGNLEKNVRPRLRGWLILIACSVVVAVSAGTWLYVRQVYYYHASGIPNLKVERISKDGNQSVFTISGEHIGAIGSIGNTSIDIEKNEANILLVRELISERDNQSYKLDFTLPESVNTITFGPHHDVMWTASNERR